MHQQYGERQIFVMSDTFDVEIETNGTELYVAFKKDEGDTVITRMVIDTEKCDTDVLNQQALFWFQSRLVDEICQGICKHLLNREKGRLFYDLNHYSSVWGKQAETIFATISYDKSNLKQ